MNNQTDPELLRRLLLGNIRCLLRHRYGATLPDDDAGREDLFEMLLQVSLRQKSPAKVMRNTIEVWAPWMDAAEAFELVQRIELLPLKLRYRTAKDLGQRFNVTNVERERFRLWQIAPVDMTDADMAEWRKTRRTVRNRLRMQRKRRQAGTRSRPDYLASSKRRQKPWAAEGVSRATWYRRRETATVRQVRVPINSSVIRGTHTCLTEIGAPSVQHPRGARTPVTAHNRRNPVRRDSTGTDVPDRPRAKVHRPVSTRHER
jgi:hypothetical protein